MGSEVTRNRDRRVLWCRIHEDEWPRILRLQQLERCASGSALVRVALNNLLVEAGEEGLLPERKIGRSDDKLAQNKDK